MIERGRKKKEYANNTETRLEIVFWKQHNSIDEFKHKRQREGSWINYQPRVLFNICLNLNYVTHVQVFQFKNQLKLMPLTPLVYIQISGPPLTYFSLYLENSECTPLNFSFFRSFVTADCSNNSIPRLG